MTHVRAGWALIAGAAAVMALAGTAHGQIFLEPRPWWPVYFTSVPPLVVSPPPPETREPPPAPAVPPPSPLHIVQADAITAGDVRADTIYADSIKARQIDGTVHRQPAVPFKTRGGLKMSSVVASTIYANRIDARTVTAKNIYVRELQRE